MILKTYFVALLFFCCLHISDIKAQSYILYGDRTFGGNSGDSWGNIVYPGNNKLIIGGSSGTNVNGDKTDSLCNPLSNQASDVWILKIDTAFNILWQNDLGGDYSEAQPILNYLNNKGVLLFAVSSTSDSACDKTEHTRDNDTVPPYQHDYWICMADSNGTVIWDKTLGGSSVDNNPQIVQLTSGDLIVSGISSSPVSGDKTAINYGGLDYWTVKLDTVGNKLWDKVYGGTGQEWAQNNEFSVLACPNGNFILAGSTNSPVSGDVSDTSRGLWDIWVIKIDNGGNKIWDKRFGGSGTDRAKHIINTKDKGFILCGWTASPQDGDVSDPPRGNGDCWVIKLDSLGNKQWDKRYGGNNGDVANWIEEAFEDGYWVAGLTSSDSSFEVTEPSYGYNDYWIFRIDSAGNKMWDKRFGAQGGDNATSFVIMPDTSIFLFGTGDSGTSAVKTDAGKGGYDYWLVHFKYTDNTTRISPAPQLQITTVYPNPAENEFTVSSKQFAVSEIKLYDVLGNEVIKSKVKSQKSEIKINIFHLPQGIYFYEVRSKEGKVVYGKVVKQ